ncbi:MAG: 5'/3'-nucleotidase SurE [Bacteroidetes bacterium]|nr:5'/3'-nucleotidase SurE [Bacteroidota bacterium]MCH8522980.1 5'/3'-nucleotidase SurE [Balneolales bacterium]
MSEKKRPLILVCNDDGFYSPGIQALAEVAMKYGDVRVIAPDRQQSAVGHSITISKPLRANKVKMPSGIDATAVNGTPADCIKLAHDKLMDVRPDLVLSGINHGSNAGINIIYSGTVSAATEATILGYPAIAVSCTDFDEDADLSGCQEAASKVIEFVLKKGLPKGVTLNVNAPAGPLNGLVWTKQADSRYVEEYDGRVDPFNKPYYWMTGKFELLENGNDLDVSVIEAGKGTVTPIQYDLTAHGFFHEIKREPLL